MFSVLGQLRMGCGKAVNIKSNTAVWRVNIFSLVLEWPLCQTTDSYAGVLRRDRQARCLHKHYNYSLLRILKRQSQNDWAMRTLLLRAYIVYGKNVNTECHKIKSEIGLWTLLLDYQTKGTAERYVTSTKRNVYSETSNNYSLYFHVVQ